MARRILRNDVLFIRYFLTTNFITTNNMTKKAKEVRAIMLNEQWLYSDNVVERSIAIFVHCLFAQFVIIGAILAIALVIGILDGLANLIS